MLKDDCCILISHRITSFSCLVSFHTMYILCHANMFSIGRLNLFYPSIHWLQNSVWKTKTNKKKSVDLTLRCVVFTRWLLELFDFNHLYPVPTKPSIINNKFSVQQFRITICYMYMYFFHPCDRTCLTWGIHLIPKWRAINYSFVCMSISPLCLIFEWKFCCILHMLMRQQGLINKHIKE